jgi:hypothetical protein
MFTGEFTAWWPHQYHIGQVDVAEVILEPHEGGRWYERGVDRPAGSLRLSVNQRSNSMFHDGPRSSIQPAP